MSVLITCCDCGEVVTAKRRDRKRCDPCGKARVRQIRKQWYADNTAHHQALVRGWRERNIDRSRQLGREKQRLRRVRKAANAVNTVTERDLMRQRQRQHDECFYCLAALGGAGQVEHVLPVSRGGSESVGNLVLACRSCNLSKKDLTVMEWRMSLRPVARRKVRNGGGVFRDPARLP